MTSGYNVVTESSLLISKREPDLGVPFVRMNHDMKK
jgi:hypothetical protein